MNGFVIHWFSPAQDSHEPDRFFIVLAPSFQDAVRAVSEFSGHSCHMALYDSGPEVQQRARRLGLAPLEVRSLPEDFASGTNSPQKLISEP